MTTTIAITNIHAIIDKNILLSKIKLLGEIYGEEPKFLQEYAREVYNLNKEDLPNAIECFGRLIAEAEDMGIVLRETKNQMAEFRSESSKELSGRIKGPLRRRGGSSLLGYPKGDFIG